jgi:small-conductance mechanosensitive channel
MKLQRKFALTVALYLTLIIFAGLAWSCDSQPSAPAATETATPETSGTQAVGTEAVSTETPSEATPESEQTVEGGDEIAPESVKEVATAVAERTPVPTPTPSRVDREIAEITSDLGIAGKTFLGITSEDWFDLALSILIVLFGYFIGARFLNIILVWIARSTKADIDDFLLRVIAPDLKWLVVLFFTRFAIFRLEFLSDALRTFFDDTFFGLAVLIVTTIGIRIINQVAAWYKANLSSDEERMRMTPVITAVQRLSSLFLLVVMLSIGLSHFGINLGVLSITVLVMAVIISIGAKDAIADAISGFIILVDQPFRVNDGIQVEELYTWGDVIEIGTRTTRIRTRDNREVIIPNTKILNSKIVNYTYPSPEYRMQVDLRISYDSDLEMVKQVIGEAVRQVDIVLPDKKVEVLLIEFGDTARKIRVRWWVADYHQPYPKTNQVTTAINSALDQAGIEIPFTTYDLNVKQVSDYSSYGNQIEEDE